MLKYRLRYLVETSLTNRTDIELHHGGQRVLILFSKRIDEESIVPAEATVEGVSANRAQETAAWTVMPPILDALSFSTGTPLLLGRCELTLKEQPENETRWAIFVGQERHPNPLRLWQSDIEEANKILQATQAPKLPLRWLRYSYHRGWPLDCFMFTWLALEELAGDAEVEVSCPHCGNRLTHMGPNRRRAFELFVRANPEVGKREFNEKIWGRARNAVFHGSKEPERQFLQELQDITRKAQEACRLHIASEYGLSFGARSPIPLEHIYNLCVLVEWKTRNKNAAFAEDFPWEAAKKLIEGEEIGFVEDAYSTISLKLLPVSQADNW